MEDDEEPDEIRWRVMMWRNKLQRMRSKGLAKSDEGLKGMQHLRTLGLSEKAFPRRRYDALGGQFSQRAFGHVMTNETNRNLIKGERF